MRHSIFILLLLSFLVSCTSEETASKIVEDQDIKNILTELQEEKIRDTQEKKIREEIAFWKSKAESQKGAFLYTEKMAHLYTNLFEVSGEVKHIHKSNEYLKKVVNSTTGNYRSNQLLSLSSNSVKLHQFRDALDYSTEAYHDARNKYGPALMTFDAAMEIGDYAYAEEILVQYENQESFDYLVRYAKYLDYKGDLTGAIASMEKAMTLIKGKNDDQYLWALSNLGDMYGHDGRIQESYDAYVAVLKVDPTNLHVLKGIAWIAFAKDKNYAIAKEVLEFVAESTSLPDAYLLLSEIAEVEGHQEAVHHYKLKFIEKALHPDHRNLYAAYIAELYLEDPDLQSKAIDIAHEEVMARPTPETFSLLAWAYYKTGNKDRAYEIIMDNVYGKTFEPNLVYRSGVILAANGKQKIGRKLLQEAKEAEYELGPVISQEINQMLKII